jgi:hypothetical protein
MFLSKICEQSEKNLYIHVHAKKKSSRRTNYGKDYKKPPSSPIQKKNDTVKKLKKKNYDKNN